MLFADPPTAYLHKLHTIRASGAAAKETSYYGPLATLLNDVGAQLKPYIRCIMHLKNTGAGILDGYLFSAMACGVCCVSVWRFLQERCSLADALYTSFRNLDK